MSEGERTPPSDPISEPRPPETVPPEDEEERAPLDEVLPRPLDIGDPFFPRMKIQSTSEEIQDDVPARFRDGGEREEPEKGEEESPMHPEAQRAVKAAILSLVLPFFAPFAVWYAWRAVAAINADPTPRRGRVQAGCAGLLATFWLTLLLLRFVPWRSLPRF